MANNTLKDVALDYPHEFSRPSQTEPGRACRPIKPIIPHVFSDSHLFLAEVTHRERRSRQVPAQYPRERDKGLEPRKATTYYYVAGFTWFRLYTINYVTGELRRLGEWDRQETATQWMHMAANDPDMTVPATRPRMLD